MAVIELIAGLRECCEHFKQNSPIRISCMSNQLLVLTAFTKLKRKYSKKYNF